ncbi:uncharacterized protein ACNS7B_017444 [Menidia menidia]
MFRISLIVIFSLIFCITGKPWNNPPDKAFQKTVLSIDDEGKLSWDVEVEAPEDTDKTQYEIDPSGEMWKTMAGYGQPLKAEEDLDELYHPSLADLQVQIQNLDPASDFLGELPRDNANMPYRQEPEEDRDEIDHPVFKDVAGYLIPLVAENIAETDQLEKDEDHISPVATELEPEEDLDELYHKELPAPALHQEEPNAAAVVPFQGKYSEPEEDMDDLYHQ